MPARVVRFVKLPQAGWPSVEEAEDTLPSWYQHASCSTIQVVGFGGVRLRGEPAGYKAVLVIDDEGRIARKLPNPWTMLLGRSDIVGDACLVLVPLVGGDFVSLPDAWARALVETLTSQYEPFTTIRPWPGTPRPSDDPRRSP